MAASPESITFSQATERPQAESPLQRMGRFFKSAKQNLLNKASEFYDSEDSSEGEGQESTISQQLEIARDRINHTFHTYKKGTENSVSQGIQDLSTTYAQAKPRLNGWLNRLHSASADRQAEKDFRETLSTIENTLKNYESALSRLSERDPKSWGHKSMEPTKNDPFFANDMTQNLKLAKARLEQRRDNLLAEGIRNQLKG